MTNSKDYQRPCDEENKEILQMKEECDRMAHEILEQIDALLMKIDYILSREKALYGVGCGKDRSLDELEVLTHGTQKLEA